MNEPSPNIERQIRRGYTLLAGAVVILIGSVIIFQYLNFPTISYLGVIIPVGILTAFGFRAVSASYDQKALQDERIEELHGKAGLNSFLLLMTLIIGDMTLNIFPEEGVSAIFVFAGLVIYSLCYGYYRYLG